VTEHDVFQRGFSLGGGNMGGEKKVKVFAIVKRKDGKSGGVGGIPFSSVRLGNGRLEVRRASDGSHIRPCNY